MTLSLSMVKSELYSFAGIIREYRKSLDFDSVANSLKHLAESLDAVDKGDRIAELTKEVAAGDLAVAQADRSIEKLIDEVKRLKWVITTISGPLREGGEWTNEYAIQMGSYTISDDAKDSLVRINSAIELAEENA